MDIEAALAALNASSTEARNGPMEAVMTPGKAPHEMGLLAPFDRSREDRLIDRIEPRAPATKTSKTSLYVTLKLEPEQSRKTRFCGTKNNHATGHVVGGLNHPSNLGLPLGGGGGVISANSAENSSPLSAEKFSALSAEKLNQVEEQSRGHHAPLQPEITIPMAGCTVVCSGPPFVVLAARLDAVCIHYTSLSGQEPTIMDTQRFGLMIREKRAKFIAKRDGRIYSGSVVKVKDAGE